MYLFKSQIRYSECDSQARLSLAGLLNYFQDCSTSVSYTHLTLPTNSLV